MALSNTHTFVSPKVDGGDSTLLRPSNWNAEHTMTVSGRSVLGKSGTGTGAVAQIDISADIMTLLQSASFAAVLTAMGVTAHTTGDAKLTMKSAADTGWIMFNNGTIGNAASNATTRANADTAALYTLIHENVNNTYAPIYTSGGVVDARGASAAADYAANKRLAVPRTLGRALVFAGASGLSGLTTRDLGHYHGAETMTLLQGHMPVYNLSAGALTVSGTVTPSAEVRSYNGNTLNGSGGITDVYRAGSTLSYPWSGSIGGTIPSGGSDSAFDLSQASASPFYVMVKL